MGKSSPINPPTGGGALQGLGEKFSPDSFTGTGNFSVPISTPAGRDGLTPHLSLLYSTGQGNSAFGLGWTINIPCVRRKLSTGVPTYADPTDVFILSDAEDLVPVPGAPAGRQRYRPFSESLFARIEHVRDATTDHWEVRTKDGLTSFYGTPGQGGTDPAVIADPDNRAHVQTWSLTRVVDRFGNQALYAYMRDAVNVDGTHHWDQLYLSTVQYNDYGDLANPQFLVSVELKYEKRPDPFSNYRAGFEIRTVQRCTAIETHTHAGADLTPGVLHMTYADELSTPAPNNVSLLAQVQTEGRDGSTSEWMPPLSFNYTTFTPTTQRFIPLTGPSMPVDSLSDPHYDLVDLFGTGLPDIVYLGDTVRYWRNLGEGKFDWPRFMDSAPAGLSLADPGVQLMDADGDGRTDLVVTTDTISGYFPLSFAGTWDRKSFRRYAQAPTFSLKDPDVHWLDLDGDGVTDALRSSTRFECYFNGGAAGWTKTKRVARAPLADFPDVTFSDDRVKFADMTGDGLQDIVYIHGTSICYWSNLGGGTWSARVTMAHSPKLPLDYDPKRLLLGDVDGDGLADLVYVDTHQTLLWTNQGGNAWSDPLVVRGTPAGDNLGSVRLVDLLGNGTSGVLWSAQFDDLNHTTMYFLDFTGEMKPYLLNGIDNHRGAMTQITYASSTAYYLADQASAATAWSTPLPFPVQVVARAEAIDQISGGKLSTEYSYHHGYWDGIDREFRGFGRVDTRPTESFADFNSGSGLRVGTDSFCPPTETRVWYYQGPIIDLAGDWQEPDYSKEYWTGDPGVLSRPAAMTAFLNGLPRDVKRQAIRSMRGQMLRSEVYALDGTPLEEKPYTVVESFYGVREEQPPTVAEGDRAHIFLTYKLAERTTQWERGSDPMHRFAFIGEPDADGQATQHLDLAVPRGRDFRSAAASAAVPYLGSLNRMEWAKRNDATVYMLNRPLRARSYEIVNDGSSDIFTLSEAVFAGTAATQLLNQTVHFYDGDAFTGLPYGMLGDFGMMSKVEELGFTRPLLQSAYRSGAAVSSPPEEPPYLNPSGLLWTAEYPPAFQSAVAPLAGYTFHPADAVYAEGYYVATSRRRYDFQSGAAARGSVLAKRDAMNLETTMVYDTYGLLVTQATDPGGMVTRSEYDYRVLQIQLMTDPNGNQTRYAFSPTGRLISKAVMGKPADNPGDTPAVPGTTWQYDDLAFVNSKQPTSARTVQRVHHVNESGVAAGDLNATIESIVYSDGFGRVIQSRAQTLPWIFGESLRGDAGLPAALTAAVTDAVGQTTASTPVLVSQWQVYDNRAQVVEKYEPFYSQGWDYSPATEVQRGNRTRLYYDPLGNPIRTVRADNAETLIVFGIPPDLTHPETFAPTPWEAYTYDSNDNAGRTHPATSTAYADHWNTPASVEMDALGRIIRAVQRLGPAPADWLTTRSTFDIKGNVLSITDPLGRVVSTQAYDLRKNVLRSEQMDAGLKRTVYDASNQVVEHRDAKGALTVTGYDGLGRAIRRWSRDSAALPATLRQRMVYGDAAESGLTQAQAAATNVLGVLVQQYDGAGLSAVPSNDFKGNPLTKTRQVISDAALQAYFDAGASRGWTVPVFAVDWQPASGQSWEARAAELLDSDVHAMDSTFDALNRVTLGRYPTDVENKRREVRPTYAPDGGLQSVTVDGAPYIQWIAHNAYGQRILTAYANGTMTRAVYDSTVHDLRRLRTEFYTSPAAMTFHSRGTVLQDSVYQKDLVGNVILQQDRARGCGIPNTPAGPDALDRQFGYDPGYKLLYATGREADVIPVVQPWQEDLLSQDPTATRGYREDYLYDAAGNLQALHHQAGTTVWNRALSRSPATNQLLALTVGSAPGLAYGYDACGNIVSEASSRFMGWDCHDRLSGFQTQATPGSQPSLCALYLYDSSGARVKKWVRDSADGVESTVYIDGVFEIRQWSNGQNNTLNVNEQSQRLARIRLGPAEAGDTSPAIEYFVSDYTGSSALVIDDTGGWVNREEFTPWGQVSFGGFRLKRYRFIGKERDTESGFDYVGARYYAHWLGRWISTDPAGMKGGFNLYTYGHNNPVNQSDPTGMDDGPANAADADERDAGAAEGEPVKDQSHEDDMDAGASHNDNSSGLSLVKTEDAAEAKADLPPGGAAAPALAQKGFQPAETNKHQNAWAKKQTVQGVKAGAVDFSIDMAQMAMTPGLLIRPKTVSKMMDGLDSLRIQTDTALASNVSSGTYFTLTLASMGAGEVVGGMDEMKTLGEVHDPSRSVIPESMIDENAAKLNAQKAESETVTLTRFFTEGDPQSLRPNVTKQPADVQERIYKLLNSSPGMKQQMAELHMRGIRDFMPVSPFVSMVDNPTKLAMTPDWWAKTITTGMDYGEGNGLVKRAPSIGIFRVPKNRLVFPVNDLSVHESEVLFVGDDLHTFLIHSWDNPY